MDEFELIRRYFAPLTPPDENLRLGIGDDCALLDVPHGQDLSVTTDTLVAGRHFPERTAPAAIGWKSLAVNLSDLAAMGAQPRWFTLALTLPEADEKWLAGFAAGLRELASEHAVTLIGGDTTRGPLSITITAMGVVPDGEAMRRSGAKAGDAICVTGTLGDAGLGLRRWRELDYAIERKMPRLPAVTRDAQIATNMAGAADALTSPVTARHRLVRKNPIKAGNADDQYLIRRLEHPAPRIAAGLALRSLAHAAIDVSDGLVGDLGHVAEASGVGAQVKASALPASKAFDRVAPPAQRLALQVAAGDDYELCVCLPPDKVKAAQRKLASLDVPLTVIGEVTKQRGVRVVDDAGKVVALDTRSYRHFE